ncbi:inorganic phosphate transporter [Solidesulfovibrio magneticus]|uniref:Uncharacterized protein n=1 Tax=Solidesulfovibrio magneticus (strain ATCC 700980 / DSM 13731 / RS-1) TaxID=573370 RepID=C4XN95_SOLM1|nr:hypothetical protein [Solidesulfovibrio magneticus]BAH77398.1 hypothetical protein DMR_39070 [Solidesulfovibrio magneticus RS-1]
MGIRQEKIKLVTVKLFLGLFYVAAAFTVWTTGTYFLGLPLSTPLVVFLIGGVGGFISIHRRLQTMDEEALELYATSLLHLYISPLIGGILAVILYFFFLSQIVSSPIFPNFKTDDPAQYSGTIIDMYRSSGLSFSEWAKLAFWSFVAGYSEDFVLAVVDSVKASAIDKVRGTKTQPAQQGNP